MSVSEIENHVPTFPVQLSPVRPMFKAAMPLPPGVNASYQVVHGHHRLALTPEGKQFKADAAIALLSHDIYDYSLVNAVRDASHRKGHKPPLQLYIKFYFETLWKRDIDGGIKAVQDALFDHIELNDNLVTSLVVTKEASSDNPRVEVELRCFVPVQ